MPYDISGRGVDPEGDGDDGMALKAGLGFIAAMLIIALAWVVIGDAPRTADADAPQATYRLVLDCSNSAQMHNHGLPTKADVMEWHLHGQWGYCQDGMLYAFADLPGRDEVWDELYGIDPNPNFDK